MPGSSVHTQNDERVAQALHTLDQLVNVFNFSFDLANRAVNAIGDKSDITLAYNYCLDHGGADTGGPVAPKRVCPHLRYHNLNLKLDSKCKYNSLNICQHGQCSNADFNSDENWICLGKNCSRVLCSRYVQSQEELHRNNGKSHCVAISLADLSVWCYQCNAYLKHQSLEKTLQKLEGLKFGKCTISESNSRSPNMSIQTGFVYRPMIPEGKTIENITPCQHIFELIERNECMSDCLAIEDDHINPLVDMIFDQNSSQNDIRNGVVLLDDPQDPRDFDNVAEAAFYSLQLTQRVLIINWGIFEGTGKRIHSDCNEFKEIPELTALSQDDGVKYVNFSLRDTLSDRIHSSMKLIRNWGPQLIFVRAGFWGDADPLSACEAFLSCVEKKSVPSANGRIVLVFSAGGRPPLEPYELESSADAILLALKILTKPDSLVEKTVGST